MPLSAPRGSSGRWRADWLASAGIDGLWILLPAFLTSLVALFLPEPLRSRAELSTQSWFILVLSIDVAHVYGTFFRTYGSASARGEFRWLLTLTPIFAWAAGIWLYRLGPGVFWRALAYLAVFHFVRQQYGFVRLYGRKESRLLGSSRQLHAWVDGFAVSVATLYPLLHWHLHQPRNFNWFVEGDFFRLFPNAPEMSHAWDRAGFTLWCLGLGLFLARDLARGVGFLRTPVQVPKSLWVYGTALSWWVGIMQTNGDFPFTLTNVVSHGVPYLALVWILRKRELGSRPLERRLIPPFLKFVAFLWGLAFIEEALWDVLVWRDHPGVFSLFYTVAPVGKSFWLAVLVPFLALPQSTHYLFDGWIWKVRNPKLRQELA